MKADIPDNPNEFLVAFFVSPQWIRVGREVSQHVLGIWQARVAHLTGALAASGRIEPSLGGEAHDRVVFDIIVGEGTPRGGYGASHNFGIGGHPGSRVPPTNWMPQPPANDLLAALAIVDAMSGMPSSGGVTG